MLFANPALLVAFYDPAFTGGGHKVYKWQSKIGHAFATRKANKPKQVNVVANNGSGKSAFLIGGAAVWMAMEFKQSQTAITSSSGAQLDLQSMRAVKRIAQAVNEFHGTDLWDIQYRHLEFKPNGSMIDARKSDEEGTMEGFHPIVPGGEFAILVDEGKSISEPIYAAILKWTGFTRRMDVSSAGEPTGTFYNNHISGRWESFKVTADDCPHISQETKDEIIATYGVSHPYTRSILFSEFTSVAGSLVLTYETVNRCIRMGREGVIEHKKEEFNRCGLDLSGGGDETVLSVWNGNKQLALESVQSIDSVKQANEIIKFIQKWEIPAENRKADAGGLGKGTLDILAAKGYPFKRIWNQSRPVNPIIAKNYGNRGTEMWYRFSKLVEDCSVILLPDNAQVNQLSNRYFKQQLSTDKIILEPKAEARSKGHPSPDRADATVLAMDDYLPAPAAPEKQGRDGRKMTGSELEERFDELIEEREKNIFGDGDGSLTQEHITGTKGLHKLL